MTPENREIPDWAQQDRQADMAWISENLDTFWAAARLPHEAMGRGAIVVDATIQPVPGAGNPFGYFSQEQIEAHGDEDIGRMVAEYDPTRELVLVMLKSADRTSTYRVHALPDENQETEGRGIAQTPAREPPSRSALEPPDVKTLMEWESEGGCEAACPHGCWVEPDGTCPHGNPSWLLRLGLI